MHAYKRNVENLKKNKENNTCRCGLCYWRDGIGQGLRDRDGVREEARNRDALQLKKNVVVLS